MPRLFLTLMAAVWGLLLLPPSVGMAQSPKRVALVIGNGAYQNVARLPNPLRDASAIADMFRKAGFDKVIARQDVGNLEFKRALREFGDAASDADIAVIYYAGHGIQVRDMNYMIPVDAKLATEIDAEDEAVSLDRMIASLEPARRLRLVILDACRDNPFAHTMKRRVAMRAITGGLGKAEPTLGDTLIAYAAKAGSTAEDGEGQNSPFAAALMKHLAVPGLDIRLAFGRIRDEVMKRTANKQEPFVYGSIGGEVISIVPAPAQPKAAPVGDVQRDFDLVKQINSKRAWEIFIETHKTGLHVALAREEIKRLDAAEPKVASLAPPPTPPAASGPTSDERRAWERVRNSGDRDRIRDFIARYPNSPLAENAQNTLDTLERAAEERDEKARIAREAAQKREDEARAAKAAEAERQRVARQREEEQRLAKLSEVERQKAEREAARRREEEEQRLAKAAEAERQKSEREALRRREDEQRLAKAAELERQKTERATTRQSETCQSDEDRLERLRGSAHQGWAREDLGRLQRDTACERVRSQVIALLSQPGPQAVREPEPPKEPAANRPELVRSAQSELRRLGCFAGRDDGSLNSATREALQRYLSQKGLPSRDANVTQNLVLDLRDESARVCPLTCSRGEHPEGDRCVVDAKPEKKEEPKREAARPKPEPKREAARPKPEPKREAARPKPEPRREAARPAPQPQARSQAAAPARVGGGMIGIGF
jgi:Caspase domain